MKYTLSLHRSCFLAAILLLPSLLSAQLYIPDGGIVLFEAESAEPQGGWEIRTDNEGYWGDGYAVFQPENDSGSTIRATLDHAITYTFGIKEPGRYRFRYRNAAPERSEHNDSFISFPDTGAVRVNGRNEASLGVSPFKVYQNESNDSWTWVSQTVDHDAWQIYVDFAAPGVYRLRLYGRSSKLKVDRILLLREGEDGVQATRSSQPLSQISENNWFGAVFPAADGWIDHWEHGWLYSPSGSDTNGKEGLWLWDERLGWWWTGGAIYPFVFSDREQSWLYYFDTDSSRIRWFYNYATEAVMPDQVE